MKSSEHHISQPKTPSYVWIEGQKHIDKCILITTQPKKEKKNEIKITIHQHAFDFRQSSPVFLPETIKQNYFSHPTL